MALSNREVLLSSVTKRGFSDHERYAVYVVHGEKCYICTRPLDLESMEIDHLVPERLLNQPLEFAKAVTDLGLSKGFDIQSCENWLPACGPCNRRKSSMPWSASLLVQQSLQRAKDRAERVRETIADLVSRRAISNAFNALKRAKAEGVLTDGDRMLLQSLIEFQHAHRTPDMADEPIRLSPFLEVISDNGWIIQARGRYGVGGRPSRPDAHSSFDCPRCGPTAWSGARCVSCGEMSDE